MTLPYEAIVQGLMRQGVPRDRAERAAAAQLAPARTTITPAPAPSQRPAIVWPVRLTLPWSALCSDNVHERGSLIRLASGDVAPRKVLDARYKAARDKTRTIASAVIGDAVPIAAPLSLVARVWLPGGSHRNDAINFSKCCHDALQGIVYDNDRWLYRVTWERAGVDIDAPRAELTITPLLHQEP